MAVSELDQLLSDAAGEVLETMFFTSLVEEGEPAPSTDGPWVCAQLSFSGARAGRLGVRVPVGTAHEIAANFLGLEGQDLTEARVDDVICELTNMVCGLVMGRMESGGLIELTKPELGSRETGCSRGEPAACRTLALEGGAMEVWLEWETPQ